MKYQLFVAEKCTECQIVLDFIKLNEIEVQISNVDIDNSKPPIDVFAFPALFKGPILLAYGSDINRYLKNKS